MQDLEKQIKQLEQHLDNETLYIEEQYEVFHQEVNAPKIMGALLLGAFFFGYSISRKRTLPGVLAKLASIGFTARVWYTKVKNILPFLPF